MALKVTDAKKGMVIRYEGELYQITKYDHVTPGNWRAIHHLYLKNMRTGRQKEVRMGTSDMIEPVYLETKNCQYLYRDAGGQVFMDNDSYEQFHLPQEVIEDALRFIVEGDTVQVVYAEGEPISVQLPASVVLEIVEAEDAVKGDTVSNIQKAAKTKTGFVVKVPAHIKVGERIKISTDTGEFQGRAS
jgi:elongation factor P